MLNLRVQDQAQEEDLAQVLQCIYYCNLFVVIFFVRYKQHKQREQEDQEVLHLLLMMMRNQLDQLDQLDHKQQVEEEGQHQVQMDQ